MMAKNTLSFELVVKIVHTNSEGESRIVGEGVERLHLAHVVRPVDGRGAMIDLMDTLPPIAALKCKRTLWTAAREFMLAEEDEQDEVRAAIERQQGAAGPPVDLVGDPPAAGAGN